MSRRSQNPSPWLEPLPDDAYRELFALIQNPPPGSAIEAAKVFGVDLFATLENLRSHRRSESGVEPRRASLVSAFGKPDEKQDYERLGAADP